ncbi:MAG: protein translocase subunit SecD, partial [Cyanobacteria bacterium J06628_6]
MGKHRITLAAILALALAAVVTIVQLPTNLGLDLRGGSQLTLEIQTTDAVGAISDRDLEAVQRVIENRVNGLGVSEAVVQPAPPDKLLIQLPGVSDPAQAERVLGGTAQLEFRTQKQGTENQIQSVAQVLQQQEIQLAVRLD